MQISIHRQASDPSCCKLLEGLHDKQGTREKQIRVHMKIKTWKKTAVNTVEL